MTHRTFGAERLSPTRAPITFDFGIYGEETFTVVPETMLGDCFDLADVPDPTPTNDLEAARACARFIERMLDLADRPRFKAALYRIPSSESMVIVDCATWIAGQVSGFPTRPPAGSSRGRGPTGRTSKPRPAGRHASKK